MEIVVIHSFFILFQFLYIVTQSGFTAIHDSLLLHVFSTFIIAQFHQVLGR